MLSTAALYFMCNRCAIVELLLCVVCSAYNCVAGPLCLLLASGDFIPSHIPRGMRGHPWHAQTRGLSAGRGAGLDCPPTSSGRSPDPLPAAPPVVHVLAIFFIFQLVCTYQVGTQRSKI